MTNQEFASSNQFFRSACDFAKIQATPRQASKFRNSKGFAFCKARDRIGLANFIRQKEIDRAFCD